MTFAIWFRFTPMRCSSFRVSKGRPDWMAGALMVRPKAVRRRYSDTDKPACSALPITDTRSSTVRRTRTASDFLSGSGVFGRAISGSCKLGVGGGVRPLTEVFVPQKHISLLSIRQRVFDPYPQDSRHKKPHHPYGAVWGRGMVGFWSSGIGRFARWRWWQCARCCRIKVRGQFPISYSRR